MDKTEYKGYYRRSNYKLLEYTENATMNKIFADFEINIDRDSDDVNLKSFIEETVIPTQQFYDRNYTNGWIEKLYNLHLPDNYDEYKSLKIKDIKDGKHKKTVDDKKYLAEVLNLDLIKNDKQNLQNLDFLIIASTFFIVFSISYFYN